MSTPYTPLHDPERDAHPYVLSVDAARQAARGILDAHAVANIHDRDATVSAAVALDYVLRDLLAALDAEAGR